MPETVVVRCSNCDENVGNEARLIHEYEDGTYCESCWNELFVACGHCGETTTQNSDRHTRRGYYCEACWDEYFVECNGCNDYFLIEGETRTDSNGDTYCEDCYYDRFSCCEGCGEEVCNDEVYHANDDCWCENCYQDRFETCNECNNVFRRDNMRWNEADEIYVCEECYGTERLIHDYSFFPTPDFKKMPWENTLFMGVELEIEPENNKDTTIIVEKLNEYLKKERIASRFYFKHDGSIKGFELVSHPFTLQYAHKKLKFNKILKWLIESKCSSEESGRCGIHIHMNKSFFKELEIAKLRIFFSKNKEKLRLFSERKGIGENYCNYETFELRKFLRNRGQDGRYWAFNLNTNKNTVELRLFRGTLSGRRFMAILQFADAIAHFVKAVGVNSLVVGEKSYEQNSWKLFFEWIKKQTRYEQLVGYLEKENLCA